MHNVPKLSAFAARYLKWVWPLGKDNVINVIINNLFLFSEKRNIYNFTMGKSLYKYEVNLDAIFTSPKYDLENINSWH